MKRAAVFGALVAACAPTPPVERAYDGHVLEGRFVEPEAYAAFLRGAIAEESGNTKGAIVDYGAAAKLDSLGVEIWTRLGAARCAVDLHDPRADEAFGRALGLDARFGPAWDAKAKCAIARGDGAEPGREKATREILVSLTQTSHEPVVAWNALSQWAQAHGDVALWVRALQSIARFDSSKRDEVARASEQLAGAGEIAEARAVAAAAFDAGEQPLSESRHPLAARLGVDEAIWRGDVGAVRVRASRARLSLDEAAARALLVGNAELARQLVATVVRADPSALGASLMFAVAEGRDVLGAGREGRGDGPLVSGAVLVAFGAALMHVASPPDLRDALGRIPHDAIVDGDDCVTRPAVELVAQGALPAAVLPADGAVELAAMGLGARGDGDRGSLDARHAYLALALAHPNDPRARELGARLAPVASSDPVVAAARALIALASEAPIAQDAARALLAIDPADPLRAATALRLAEKAGDTDMVRRARAAMRVHGRMF
jgi:hypothetical protein